MKNIDKKSGKFKTTRMKNKVTAFTLDLKTRDKNRIPPKYLITGTPTKHGVYGAIRKIWRTFSCFHEKNCG